MNAGLLEAGVDVPDVPRVPTYKPSADDPDWNPVVELGMFWSSMKTSIELDLEEKLAADGDDSPTAVRRDASSLRDASCSSLREGSRLVKRHKSLHHRGGRRLSLRGEASRAQNHHRGWSFTCGLRDRPSWHGRRKSMY